MIGLSVILFALVLLVIVDILWREIAQVKDDLSGVYGLLDLVSDDHASRRILMADPEDQLLAIRQEHSLCDGDIALLALAQLQIVRINFLLAKGNK